jgi:hypothetical protein
MIGITEQQTLKSIVRNNPDQFRSGFLDYAVDNWHLYEGFKERAFQMAATGRDHYSAKTIIQVLRFHSDLAEVDSEFKVNDKWAADFGRLFMLRHPNYQGFFKTKISEHRDTL